jgi:hypothetical protein
VRVWLLGRRPNASELGGGGLLPSWAEGAVIVEASLAREAVVLREALITYWIVMSAEAGIQDLKGFLDSTRQPLSFRTEGRNLSQHDVVDYLDVRYLAPLEMTTCSGLP